MPANFDRKQKSKFVKSANDVVVHRVKIQNQVWETATPNLYSKLLTYYTNIILLLLINNKTIEFFF